MLDQNEINKEIKKELGIHPVIGQFSRFFIVGLINTVLDYVVFFSLSKVTGITSGSAIIIINAISFSIATTNSYILNKYWAFHDQSRTHVGQKISLFLLVSILGVALNSLIVWIVTTKVGPQFDLGVVQWLFVAKVMATCISLFWNFAGYKIFVFKK